MSYTTRCYAVLQSGELTQIGVQTLQKIIEGGQACVLDVGLELKVIQVTCSKEGRTLKAIVDIVGAKFQMLATGFIDQADYMQKIRNVMNKVRDAQLEMAWVPSAAQIKEVASKLGLPA